MKRTSIAFAVWFVLIFYGACGLVDTKKEHGPDIPGKIVFSMFDENGGGPHIFVANTDGSDKKQITHLERDVANSPSWSPDGKQIVFTTSMKSGELGFTIYIMDADGSNMRPMKMADPGRDRAWLGASPKWSPDGRKIAFHGCVNCEKTTGNLEILIYDFETDSVTPLTDHPAADVRPKWSPDGQYMTFASNREYMNGNPEMPKGDLYAYNFADQKLRRVTTGGVLGGGPGISDWLWSPDSKSILIKVPDPLFERPITGSHWFYLDPVNSDTLGSLSLSPHLEISELTFPVKWSDDQQILMILQRQKQRFGSKLYFYDFRSDSLYESIDFDANDMSNDIDWHIDNR